MHLWALRHGQSEYNLLGLCNDDPAREVRLTGEGRRQACKASTRLQETHLDAAFSSPLPRALETTRILLRDRDLEFVEDPRLADIRSGFESLPVADYFSAIAHDPLNAKVHGGESLRDHYERVSGFLDWLAAEPFQGVLLVAHEETLRAIAAWSEGGDILPFIGLPFANARPYRFHLSGRR
jgi:probable phosphoglycerate mutase